MCEICSQFRPLDDDCVYQEDSQFFSTVIEGADAASNAGTAYDISVGDTFTGALSSETDVDWIEVHLVAGESYQINLNGSTNFVDSVLYLYNSNGTIVGYNDDGGPGYYSALSYTASSTGTYYIGVEAYQYGASNYGSYSVELTEIAPPDVATVEELATYLTNGFWEDNGAARRAFDTSSSNVITVNISDLNATERGLARAALEAWEMVADITFQETTSAGADITFYNDENGDSTSLNAYSTSSVSGNTITSSEVIISSGWVNSSMGDEIGTYGFQTYIHEIGHALGLGHQSNYNGSASYPADADFINDSWQLSIMSYFSQDDNTAVDASYASLITTMMADIYAIQDLYGAANAGSATDGDTRWGAGTGLNNYLGDIIEDIAGGGTNSYSGDPIAFTIFDASGVDTIDLSFSPYNDMIDMRDGQFSNVIGLTGNIGIAVGTVIENLFAGSGNNTIYGNSADNEIHAGAGNDAIEAMGGDDTVYGDAGEDTADLGSGNDRFDGSTGDAYGDLVYGGSGSDTMVGGNGDDEFRGEAGWDRLYGGIGSDTLVGGDGLDRLYGQDDDDTIYGDDGDDLIYGGDGDDWVSGGTDNDTISGDAGNDTLLGGDGDDEVNGGTGNDTISGNAGIDTLNGGDGNDIISGGAGTDYIYGDAGADRVNGDDGGDWISGGDGWDRLWGGDGADYVYGNDGVDRLYGQDGNDTLYGGADGDYMYGGNDNDFLRGEGGADIMTGDAGLDTLYGDGGGDRMYGGTQNDTLIGGDGWDRIYGQDGDDDLSGDQGNDYLYGGLGADTLNGGTGDDVLQGNGGSDSFVFDTDALGSDLIQDFELGIDRLELSDALWDGANLTAAQIVATYGGVSGSDIILDFGDTIITLSGLTDLNALSADISLI